MRLAECLSHASVKTLRSILKEQNLPSSMHSKHDMFQTILYEMRVPTHISTLFECWLDEWGTAFLRIVLSRRSRFSSEEMSALFTSNGHQINDLEHALTQGWLFTKREVSMRPEFIVPEDVHKQLRTFAVQSIRSRVTERDDTPLIQRDEGEAIVRDLHTFLEYVAYHDVQITTTGAMYKRHTQKLMELFEVSEDLVVPQWRFGYGRRTNDYPDRLALLYDFAYHEGLIRETDQEYLRISDGVETFRQLSQRKQLQRLLEFYIRVYRKPIPRLREIIEVMRVFVTRWASCESLLGELGDLVSPFYYDDRDSVWHNRIVNVLTHLGVIRVGQDEKVTTTWFQMTKLGQELLSEDEMNLADAHQPKQPCLIVQPNFEILVTVHDSQVELALGQFCELKSAGSLRIYRILERTVMSGLAVGHNLDAWLKLVTEYSLSPVPGNVEHTLREWSNINMDSSDKPLSS